MSCWITTSGVQPTHFFLKRDVPIICVTLQVIVVTMKLTFVPPHPHSINVLRGVPILSNLNESERVRLVDALKVVRYSDGKVIIKQGEPGEDFFIIKQVRYVCMSVCLRRSLCLC